MRKRHRTGAEALKEEVAIFIDKAEIMAVLLSRGNDARAAWVDRQLPELVETSDNESLLRLLNIDPSTMTPVEARVDQP